MILWNAATTVCKVCGGKKKNISDSMQRDFTMHEHYKVKQITLALCVMCSIFRRYWKKNSILSINTGLCGWIQFNIVVEFFF